MKAEVQIQHLPLLQPVHLGHERNVIRRVLKRRNRRVLLQQPLLVDLEVGQRRELAEIEGMEMGEMAG